MGFYPGFTKYKMRLDLAISFTTEVLDELHRPLYLRHLKLLFPRRGEQCPVVEFSCMGYSPPKCSCNGNHTNIQVNHSYPYLNVYMPRLMPRVLIDSLTHAIFHVNCFQNKDICLFVDNPLIYYSGHTPINNCWSILRNHVMHSHLLFYGVPVHMKCNMPFPYQFMLICHTCIY